MSTNFLGLNCLALSTALAPGAAILKTLACHLAAAGAPLPLGTALINALAVWLPLHIGGVAWHWRRPSRVGT
jgi:hypothetical protein